jgi:hypothetical protein
MAANEEAPRQRCRLGYDVPTEHPAHNSVALVSCMSTSRPASANGSDLNWIAFTKLNTAVVAAIPSPSDSTAVATSPGARLSARQA